MNLRMIGLAAVVVFTALLPLAASAGPVDGPWSDEGATGGTDAMGGREGRAASGAMSGEASGTTGLLADAKAGLSAVSGIKGSGTPGSAGSAVTTGARGMRDARGTDAAARTTEQCGPEVASPEGIEAQTCVLTSPRARDDGPDTWARTYYRNETGGELLAVLSLMGPYGRTVGTYCPIDAGDEPAICETPRELSRGEHSAYLAVAEFSAPANSGNGDDDGENEGQIDEGTEGSGAEIEPLLLRSGSNSPAPAAH
ncbi:MULTISPECIES: hypothetical protein [unclassified Streptomyces]|uniref:hypothetical protein n=1 Tax=unclassified Streptomyces TaxID=2593676 RepID=UPI00343B85E6